MNIAFPLILFFMIIGVWFATVLQGGLLWRTFSERFPKEALSQIPCSGTNMRHPEKLFFFFRKRAIPLLKADHSIWKLRQRLKWLLILSVLIPFVGCLVLSYFCFSALR